jgi:hypothetical protein
MLYFFISIWFILAIELELRWNKVEGVNEIKTTGQIIPFVIGVLSISQMLLKLLDPAARQSRSESHNLVTSQPHNLRYCERLDRGDQM